MRNLSNRFFLKSDPYIAMYRDWDFLKVQWHSRPYEYKYVVDAVSGFGDNLKVLDLGCGIIHPGYLMLADLKNVLKVDALDLDQDLLTNGHDHFKVCKIVDDILKWKTDSIYDVVVSVSTVEHITKFRKVFKKVFSILRDGGFFVLTIDIYDGKADTWKYNIRNITPIEYRKTLTSTGFRLVGEFDDSISNDILMGSNSHFPGKHKKLKTFRFCCIKS